MSFLRQTNVEKYTPKKIKFFDLYKHSTGSGEPSDTVQAAAHQALTKAGFDDTTINKVIYENQAVPVDIMQKVAHQLNQSQVYGFYHDPKSNINNYLRKQMVKNMSIARVRKEQMLEQRSDIFKSIKNRTELGRIDTSANAGASKAGTIPKPAPRYHLPF